MSKINCKKCAKEFSQSTLEKYDGQHCLRCYKTIKTTTNIIDKLISETKVECKKCKKKYSQLVLDKYDGKHCQLCYETIKDDENMKQAISLSLVSGWISSLITSTNTSANTSISTSTTSTTVITSEHKSSKSYKKRISTPIRRNVWTKVFKDKISGKCPICRYETISAFNFECGHDIPECKGGETTVENLYPICGSCNKSIGSTSLTDYVKNVLKRNCIIPSDINEDDPLKVIEDSINISISNDLVKHLAELIYNDKDNYAKWNKKIKESKKSKININIVEISRIYIQD
jgi:5-methylcytosine-specific restriction endonuclease McrA